MKFKVFRSSEPSYLEAKEVEIDSLEALLAFCVGTGTQVIVIPNFSGDTHALEIYDTYRE